MSRPSGAFRFSVMLRLLRWRFWKSKPSRASPSSAPGVPAGVSDRVRAPVGELAHAGRARAHAGEVEHDDAFEGEPRVRHRASSEPILPRREE